MTAALAVTLGGHGTALRDAGDGDPMLFLHALGLDGRMADPLRAQLRGRRVVAFDQRAHGASTAPADGFGLQGCADDAVELLDALGLDRVDVVGTSMGGAVAQLLALGHPERVRSLTLVCTFARAPREVFLARAEELDREGTMERWFGPHAADDAVTAYACECLAATTPQAWKAWWRGMAGVDVLDDLPRLDVPVRLVAGGADTSTPPAVMAALHERLPRSRLTVVSGAAHMLALTAPRALAAELHAEAAA